MRALSESTARVSAKNFERKFIALGRIAEQWTQIMGADMASKAFPARIYYRKPKKKDDKPQTTLYIAAADAHATTLHYQTDLILERINALFGDAWVHKIKFVAASDIEILQQNKVKRQVSLSKTQQDALDQNLENITDPDMQDYLRRLGHSIMISDAS